jgi:DNA-binding HxlR family transcriptional regulator
MISTTDRTEIPADCPIDRMLRLLWREWTTHILWVLGGGGPAGFGELRRRLAGISSKVLTERLRRMERDGLIHREREENGLRRATYSLTAKGHEIHAALLDLGAVAERW